MATESYTEQRERFAQFSRDLEAHINAGWTRPFEHTLNMFDSVERGYFISEFERLRAQRAEMDLVGGLSC